MVKIIYYKNKGKKLRNELSMKIVTTLNYLSTREADKRTQIAATIKMK